MRQFGGCLAAQTRSLRDHGRWGGYETAACRKDLDPASEQVVGIADQPEQFRCNRLLLAQPEIESLLETPRRLTKIGEANHAAAALEGMRRTADGRQRVDIVRVGRERRRFRLDRRKDLARLLKEDLEQFGIDGLVR